jgi:hypothetical protein
MLHILNGDSTRMSIEQSGVPGEFLVWPDILHDGPTPLATGEEWIAARTRHLSGLASGGADDIREEYRRRDAGLESFREHDEVVFWFEHDLFDQLLLIRHLWWMDQRGAAGSATKFSLVCGDVYLGMLRPEQFPPLFDARRAITASQIADGTRVWRAVCADDPTGLAAEYAGYRGTLPFLRDALGRFLQEFPSAVGGLSRTERQILDVLGEGDRSPEQAFVQVARMEERIFMGDLSFWVIVRALGAGPRPLVTFDVELRDGALPTGIVRITDAGRQVLSGRLDRIALNGIDRWQGGVHLTPERVWRWTGTSLLPQAS